ncbi:hypothetical protein OC834_004624 [Tilletia horrida]|nr:hypothetical protein OC834_004624 [Tilletia horrida]
MAARRLIPFAFNSNAALTFCFPSLTELELSSGFILTHRRVLQPLWPVDRETSASQSDVEAGVLESAAAGVRAVKDDLKASDSKDDEFPPIKWIAYDYALEHKLIGIFHDYDSLRKPAIVYSALCSQKQHRGLDSLYKKIRDGLEITGNEVKTMDDLNTESAKLWEEKKKKVPSFFEYAALCGSRIDIGDSSVSNSTSRGANAVLDARLSGGANQRNLDGDLDSGDDDVEDGEGGEEDGEGQADDD